MANEEITKKPPRKKQKTIRQQCAEDMAAFEQRITASFSSQMDRLEQALLARPQTSHTVTAEVHTSENQGQEPNSMEQSGITNHRGNDFNTQSSSQQQPFNFQRFSSNPASQATQFADMTSTGRNEVTALNSHQNTALTQQQNNNNRVFSM